MPIQINDRIILKSNLRGVVRYIGPVEGRSEEWVGIELEEPKGSNNGKIGGTRYFYCPENHGLFVKYEKLTRKMTSVGDSTVHDMFAEAEGRDRRAGRPTAYLPGLQERAGAERHREDESALPGSDGLAEENRKIKELLESVLHRWSESLNAVHRGLQELQRRIESISRAYQARTADDGERALVVGLVSEIMESSRRRDRAKTKELYERFKRVMEKHKIKVD